MTPYYMIFWARRLAFLCPLYCTDAGTNKHKSDTE